MKTIIKLIIPLYLLLSYISCDSMDSLHEKYLEWGEAIYTGVVDSLKVYPGYNRVKLTWEVNADPRIKKTVIYWDDRSDSVVVDVIRSQSKRIQMEHSIELPEGGYMFELATKDNEGHQSRYIEINTNIYGAFYANSISLRGSRQINLIEVLDQSTVNVHLGTVEDNTYRYSELVYLTYESGSSQAIEKIVTIENQTDNVTLENIRLGDKISICSMFFPSENAMDGVSAKKTESQIPTMALPVPGQYSISKFDCFYGTTDRSKTSGTIQLDVATGEFSKGANCYMTTLGIESYANWKLGFKINDDYSVEPYVAKVNGTWVVEYINYEPEKNYYDPVTKTLYYQCVVYVPGAWTITTEAQVIRIVE